MLINDLHRWSHFRKHYACQGKRFADCKELIWGYVFFTFWFFFMYYLKLRLRLIVASESANLWTYTLWVNMFYVYWFIEIMILNWWMTSCLFLILNKFNFSLNVLSRKAVHLQPILQHLQLFKVEESKFLKRSFIQLNKLLTFGWKQLFIKLLKVHTVCIAM